MWRRALLLRRSFSTDTTGSKVQHALSEIRKSFPDSHNLHARIDLALRDSSNIRIAVIPFHCRRTDINGVLDAVLADPLASDQSWYDQFRNRLLAKDTLVKFSPVFDHVLTHNSLVEFPVPYRQARRDVEILEANSFKDSYDHIKHCHLHIFVSTNVHTALTHQLPSTFPSALVLDTTISEKAVDLGDVTVVSTKEAQRGIDLIAQSPSNATEYHTLHSSSNIQELEDLIFQSPQAIEIQLLESIASTCTAIIAPGTSEPVVKAVDLETKSITAARHTWAKNAHSELQTTLTDGIDNWCRSKFPWWALYFKVDDVHDSLNAYLPSVYIPKARGSLDYLLGRIDAFAETHYIPERHDPLDSEALGSELIAESLTQTLSTDAVTLHNNALKSLATIIFGLQLPMTVVPILGIYFYDYSWYSMGSLIALGVVVGFKRLQSSWAKQCQEFRTSVLERARAVIADSEKLIWQSWESKVIAQQDLVQSRKALVDKYVDTIDEVKKTCTK